MMKDQASDIDPVESQEWQDAIADVIERAKNAIRPAEAPGQAPSPKAAPVPAMAPTM